LIDGSKKGCKFKDREVSLKGRIRSQKEKGKGNEDFRLDAERKEEMRDVERKVDKAHKGDEERVILERLGDKNLDGADERFEWDAKAKMYEKTENGKGEKEHQNQVKETKETLCDRWTRGYACIDDGWLKETKERNGEKGGNGTETKVDESKDREKEEKRQKTCNVL